MMFLGFLVFSVTLALPFTPLNHLLGFTPLPVTHVLLLLLITATYVVASGLVKQPFRRRMRIQAGQ